MSVENNKRFERRPVRSVDGFLNAPVRQDRKVIQPFVGRAQQRDLRQTDRRQLDNFRRTEGYHPFAPRQIGASQEPAAESPRAAEASPSLLNKTMVPSRHGRRQRKQPLHQRSKWRRIAKRSVLAVGLIIVLTGGFLFGKGYLQLRHIFHGGGNPNVALAAGVNPSKLKGEGDGRVNILLLGIGGPGHDGPDLTDTMLVASIDPVNNQIALLSVPRDLWIKQPNDYMGMYQKINAAYESGKYSYLKRDDSSNSNVNAVDAGFKTADQAVSGVLGIPIDYNVLVNFQAFQQAINTVGGVTVNVPTQLYDPTMAWQNNWNPVLAKPGIQTMDGYHALLYARSRETSSDFARTERQRAILMALKSKVLSAGTLSNPLKISSLMSAFGDNVQTDLSLSDAEALYNLMKKVSGNNTKSYSLDNPAPNNLVTTGDVDGLSVVEPTAGEFDYSKIQSYVRNTLRDGYLAKENATVSVLNGTVTPGLASDMADTLKSYGYTVGTVGDAPTSTYQNTVLVDLTNGKDKYTKNYLQERLQVKAVTSLPDKSIKPGNANFVIIIGQDEANTSQT